MNYNNIQKKYTIKIPKNVTTIYCDKKNIITFIGPIKTTSLKVKNKIFFSESLQLLNVSEFLKFIGITVLIAAILLLSRVE